MVTYVYKMKFGVGGQLPPLPVELVKDNIPKAGVREGLIGWSW